MGEGGGAGVEATTRYLLPAIAKARMHAVSSNARTDACHPPVQQQHAPLYHGRHPGRPASDDGELSALNGLAEDDERGGLGGRPIARKCSCSSR